MGDTKMFLFFSNVSTINAFVSEIVFYGIWTVVEHGQSAYSAPACLPLINKEGVDSVLDHEEDILPDRIMAYWAVFKEHFLHYDDFPRHRKWPTSIDMYPSTMERRLVVGIRYLCILSSRKAYLEGNEKEKLTRELLTELMVAQKKWPVVVQS